MPPKKGKEVGGKRKRAKHTWKDEAKEITEMEAKIAEATPARGSDARSDKTSSVLFRELPISNKTKDGLLNAKYKKLTDIQRASIPHSLAGRDILGAARTGSGKTLAFLIPVLEKLYRSRWTSTDGLGALVISPTRELALQIFDVLRKIGSGHQLSSGLVIGGKTFQEEQSRITRMNILVCTPGRLLQHMDETPGFECGSLEILVLDEADRLLDMGFEKTLNAIVDNLPKLRQTLLFSATQTKSVKDLARLSLKNPEYLAVHEGSKNTTPRKLAQSYMVCEAPEKFTLLYSFIKTHLNNKSLIFLSSCKQVRFAYEAFRKFRPGVPLLHLHGKQKQMKRLAIYYEFCKAPKAVLFATDVAARGLDIPVVDWVLQVDCPENLETYIHRAGRTARHESAGNSLLIVTPTEEKLVTRLSNCGIALKKLAVNPNQKLNVQDKLASLLVENDDLRQLAQKAFISYMRSMFILGDKEVFEAATESAEAYAMSLGLAVTPRIRFVQSQAKEKNKCYKEENAKKAEKKLVRPPKKGKGGVDEESDDDSSDSDSEMNEAERKENHRNRVTETLAKATKRGIQTKTPAFGSDSEDDSGDDVLVVKRADRVGDHAVADAAEEAAGPQAKASVGKMSKKQLVKLAMKTGDTSKKTTFESDSDDESDEAIDQEALEDERKKHQAAVVARMKIADEDDKMAHKEKLRDRRKERIYKEKVRKGDIKEEDGGGSMQAVLASHDDESSQEGSQESSQESSGEGSASEGDDSDDEGPSKRRKVAPQNLQSAEALAKSILQKRMG